MDCEFNDFINDVAAKEEELLNDQSIVTLSIEEILDEVYGSKEITRDKIISLAKNAVLNGLSKMEIFFILVWHVYPNPLFFNIHGYLLMAQKGTVGRLLLALK